MMSVFVLTTMMSLTPGQTGEPGKLPPPVTERSALPLIPNPEQLALPPAVSNCPSCAITTASYPPGCATGNCYGSTCDNPGPVGPPDKAWSDQSFLYYWYKPAPLPTLLVNVNGGVLTRLNGGDATFSPASGGRVSGGLWVNEPHTFGYGWSVFLMEQRSDFFSASSNNGSPQLARPFTDAVSGQQALYTVSSPVTVNPRGGAGPGYEGNFNLAAGARLAGGELYAMKSVHYCKTKSFALLAGFRYFDLDEFLELYQQTTALNGAPLMVGGPNTPNVTAINLTDRFRTRNQFYGMEVGGRGELTHKCFSFGVVAKVGIGNVYQTLDIAGQTNPGGVTGGFNALSSNIGRSNHSVFGAIAETSAELGIQISEGSRIIVAYDFLMMSEVIRPGGEIDSVINTRLLPTSSNFNGQSGPASPIRNRTSDDFFVYGLRFGYQLRY